MIALTLRNYMFRFGWEIAAFWAISIGNTFLLDRNGPPGVLRALTVLEFVALAWITVRLVLAEDGFKTSGGWQTRPFSHKIRLGLPLALAGQTPRAPDNPDVLASQGRLLRLLVENSR